jgi:hypothetical protein
MEKVDDPVDFPHGADGPIPRCRGLDGFNFERVNGSMR